MTERIWRKAMGMRPRIGAIGIPVLTLGAYIATWKCFPALGSGSTSINALALFAVPLLGLCLYLAILTRRRLPEAVGGVRRLPHTDLNLPVTMILFALLLFLASDSLFVTMRTPSLAPLLDSLLHLFMPRPINDLLPLVGCLLGIFSVCYRTSGRRVWSMLGAFSLLYFALGFIGAAWSILRAQGLMGDPFMPSIPGWKNEGIVEVIAFLFWLGFSVSILGWRGLRGRQLAALLVSGFAVLSLVAISLWVAKYWSSLTKIENLDDRLAHVLVQTAWYFFLLSLVPLAFRGIVIFLTHMRGQISLWLAVLAGYAPVILLVPILVDSVNPYGWGGFSIHLSRPYQFHVKMGGLIMWLAIVSCLISSCSAFTLGRRRVGRGRLALLVIGVSILLVSAVCVSVSLISHLPWDWIVRPPIGRISVSISVFITAIIPFALVVAAISLVAVGLRLWRSHAELEPLRRKPTVPREVTVLQGLPMVIPGVLLSLLFVPMLVRLLAMGQSPPIHLLELCVAALAIVLGGLVYARNIVLLLGRNLRPESEGL